MSEITVKRNGKYSTISTYDAGNYDRGRCNKRGDAYYTAMQLDKRLVDICLNCPKKKPTCDNCKEYNALRKSIREEKKNVKSTKE